MKSKTLVGRLGRLTLMFDSGREVYCNGN